MKSFPTPKIHSNARANFRQRTASCTLHFAYDTKEGKEAATARYTCMCVCACMCAVYMRVCVQDMRVHAREYYNVNESGCRQRSVTFKISANRSFADVGPMLLHGNASLQRDISPFDV